MRILLALLTLFFTTHAMAENRPSHGLLWNRTGLPAVFPLQVKTNAGRDFLLTLSDPSTATPALVAYIEGGRFFRVLVPPGTFEIQLEYGSSWNENEGRFTAPSALILERPLTFSVQGLGRKSGHLIDLTMLAVNDETTAKPRVTAQTLCQVTVTTVIPNCLISDEECSVPDHPGRYTGPYAKPPAFDFHLETYSRFCD